MAGEEPARRWPSDQARLAVDADGRPVIQRLRDEIVELYAWEADRVEILTVRGAPKELLHCAFVDGLLVEEVSVERMERLDGRPAVTVTRWSYDDLGRPSFVLETYESGEDRSWGGPERGPYWKAQAYTFAYDDAGELSTITSYYGANELADGEDQDAAQAAAAAGFPGQFEAPRPWFDGRTQTIEEDLPDRARAYEGLAEPLADAMYAALARRRDALGPLEFVLVASEHSVSQAVAVDATFVDRARVMGNGILEMLDVAWSEPRGAVVVDAVDTASPEVLRRLRAGNQALATQYGPRTAVDELGHAVAAELNAREWSDVAPTFLVLTAPPSDEERWQRDDRWVDNEDSHDEGEEPSEIQALMAAIQERLAALDPALTEEQMTRAAADVMNSVIAEWHAGLGAAASPAPSPLSHMEDIVGRERVEAFVVRVGDQGAQAAARKDLRPQSHDELARLLEGVGLTAQEAARLADDALWGIVLEPGGSGVSRLGGAPVLPAGTRWPTADDRPLTHLATIAMDELPDVEGREHLPPDGLLSFFADISEGAEFYEPVQPENSWGHDLVAVIYTPAGATTDEPSPPGDALVEQRVRPTPRLQLRHLGLDYGNQLFGLDALAEDAVLALAERVNGATHHQLLGYPWPVQDDPREPGQIVLLHVGNDPTIEFDFLDGGDLHFLGTPADIRARRWNRLTVWPTSC